MTTYTTIPDSDIDPESPVTTGLVTKLRDNPIAITEGASGAPSIAINAITGRYAFGSNIALSVPTSTQTDITLSDVDDPDSILASTGLFTPIEAGWYEVTCIFRYSAGGPNNFEGQVIFRGTVTNSLFPSYYRFEYDYPGTSFDKTWSFTTHFEVNGTTDNFGFKLFHTEGSTRSFAVYVTAKKMLG